MSPQTGARCQPRRNDAPGVEEPQQRGCRKASGCGTEGSTLNHQEQLLAGLGAAVAGGCLPCSKHYLAAAAGAGMGDETLLQAVTAALAIRKQAVDEMAARVHRHLDPSTAPPTEPPPAVISALASVAGVAAAYAANSPPLIRRALTSLREQGTDDRQLVEILQAARKAKEMAGTLADRHAFQDAHRQPTKPDPARCC